MGKLIWKGWQTSVSNAPQPTSILYGSNLKTNRINNQSVQLVEEIMNSQEQKAPALADKQRRLLEILKHNQAIAENSNKT
jgi:hypothetical protein